MSPPLRIVVITADPALAPENDPEAAAALERSRLIRLGLLESGLNLLATLPADPFLAERLAQLQPDMVIVDSESDARDALEHVVVATRDAPRPIVMFTNDDNAEHVDQALAAGVSAYVVSGLAPERIRPILTVAQARFRHEQALLAALDQSRDELKTRKQVDRAKALLMQKFHLSEDEAHQRLQRTAMQRGLKLAEVAQQLLDMADLMG